MLILILVSTVIIWNKWCTAQSCPRYPNIVPVDSSAFNSILQQVDTYLESVTKQTPGLITTIVYDQQQIFTKGYGKVNYFNASSRSPNGNDLVELGSITKVFTSLFTYYLRDNNMLSLNDPITKFIPNFSIKSIYDTNEPLKLRQLASHTSGLGRATPECPWHSTNCNETKILETLSERYLILPQYHAYHYSNLGFSLLGRAIEKLFCDGCYEEMIKKHILNGLNFSTYSGFNYSQNVLDNYMAVGVTYNENNEAIPAPRTSLSWINPCGGMIANANDLAKFMMFMFRNNYTVNNTVNQILDGSTINEILEPQTLLNDLSEVVGLPFEMTYELFNTTTGRMKSIWFRGKQGELSGFRSSLMLVPEYKLGVFTSALVSDVSDGYVWTNAVLHMILPVLDGILQQYENNSYTLPPNYELLIGNYQCINETNTICNDDIMNINVYKGQDGSQYLMMNTNERLLTTFHEDLSNILRAYKTEKQDCVDVDGSDAELVYFTFDNGSNQHSTSLTFLEGKYMLVA